MLTCMLKQCLYVGTPGGYDLVFQKKKKTLLFSFCFSLATIKNVATTYPHPLRLLLSRPVLFPSCIHGTQRRMKKIHERAKGDKRSKEEKRKFGVLVFVRSIISTYVRSFVNPLIR